MGLHDRLRRLEAHAERRSVPTWAEYWPAAQRERARNLDSAFCKLANIGGGDPRPFFKEDRALLEGDTEEQRKQDRDVIARYEEGYGVHYDLDVLAEKARQQLREVGHSE